MFQTVPPVTVASGPRVSESSPLLGTALHACTPPTRARWPQAGAGRRTRPPLRSSPSTRAPTLDPPSFHCTIKRHRPMPPPLFFSPLILPHKHTMSTPHNSCPQPLPELRRSTAEGTGICSRHRPIHPALVNCTCELAHTDWTHPLPSPWFTGATGLPNHHR
jgi:hypothetical protein